MDITPVGDDLHVLLTCGGENRLGCTAFSTPVTDTDPVECETSVITDVDNPEDLFCPYIAESLCKKTGQRVSSRRVECSLYSLTSNTCSQATDRDYMLSCFSDFG